MKQIQILYRVALFAFITVSHIHAAEFEFKKLKRDYVTIEKVAIATEVRIKVVKQGDGLGDMIQISSFSPDKLKLRKGFGPGCFVLKSIIKPDLKNQNIFKYELRDSHHIGLGMRGETSFEKSSLTNEKGIHILKYGIGRKEWEIHIKFVEPEF